MWTNPQFFADLLTFTKKIRKGKVRFLCSASYIVISYQGVSLVEILNR